MDFASSSVLGREAIDAAMPRRTRLGTELRMIPRYSRPEMAAIWEARTRFRIRFEIEAYAVTRWPESPMRTTFRGGRKADGQDPFCEADRGPEMLCGLVFLPAAADENATRNPTIWTVPDISSLPDNDHGRLVRRGRDLITETYAHIGPHVEDPAKRAAGIRPAAIAISEREPRNSDCLFSGAIGIFPNIALGLAHKFRSRTA
jgi:hypothetical protein